MAAIFLPVGLSYALLKGSFAFRLFSHDFTPDFLFFMTDLPVHNRSLVVLSAAASRGGVRRSACRQRGFTLLELLTVIAIVVVLAGLILGGMGYAQQKAASSRATGEIAALSNLLEAFKADFGDYPRMKSDDEDGGDGGTNVTPGNSPSKANAGFLAAYLFGKQVTDTTIPVVTDWARKNSWPESGLSTDSDTIDFQVPSGDTTISVAARYLIDPFGNPYGYSTKGIYNPTFDLWSTAGITTGSVDTNEPRWIKNW